MSSTSRLHPRDHLDEPGLFGRSDRVQWKQPESIEQLVDLRQAEVQHAFALRVRHLIHTTPEITQAAISRGYTGPQVSGPPHFNYKRLNDCLNGRRVLSLTDVARVEAITGPILFDLVVERTIITDPDLRERFPSTVGKLPDLT